MNRKEIFGFGVNGDWGPPAVRRRDWRRALWSSYTVGTGSAEGFFPLISQMLTQIFADRKRAIEVIAVSALVDTAGREKCG
jgi:hypothetical protein